MKKLQDHQQNHFIDIEAEDECCYWETDVYEALQGCQPIMYVIIKLNKAGRLFELEQCLLKNFPEYNSVCQSDKHLH